MLIGADILEEYGAVIDFLQRCLQFEINNKPVICKFVNDGAARLGDVTESDSINIQANSRRIQRAVLEDYIREINGSPPRTCEIEDLSGEKPCDRKHHLCGDTEVDERKSVTTYSDLLRNVNEKVSELSTHDQVDASGAFMCGKTDIVAKCLGEGKDIDLIPRCPSDNAKEDRRLLAEENLRELIIKNDNLEAQQREDLF
jgi:hypothetical protein